MRGMNFGRTVAVGAGLALAAMIPAASQARETAHKTHAAMSSQTLKALNARWNAEAAGYKVLQARLKALDNEWQVSRRHYGMH